VVQSLISAFGGSDGYVQVILNPVLPDKVTKAPGAEAGVKRYVLGVGFA